MTSATEAEQLSQVTAAIYDAAIAPESWPAALESACAFLKGAGANIFWQDPVRQSAMVFHSWNDDPAYVVLYVDRYLRLNPLFPAATFIEPGVVFAGGDIVPHAEFRQTVFYKEWVEPQGLIDVIGVNLHRFATSTACFSVRRSRAQGIVDAEMRRRTALLAPHVRRAAMIGREIDRQRSTSSQLADMLDAVTAGAFLVDATGRLDFVNEAGRAMLDEGRVLRLWQGLIAATDRGADRALRLAFAASGKDAQALPASEAPSIVLTDPAGGEFLAHVLPLSTGARREAGSGCPATAALFVRRAEVPTVSGIEVAARLYRLTPSETRVLEAAEAAGSVREIAGALGVSSATVKTHLASLFRKTGARRRADLTKMIARYGNPLR
jgi:DNA-binding CsgD family transcriptional regulator/PAS domain-containing protein